jgi:hypothetical protein
MKIYFGGVTVLALFLLSAPTDAQTTMSRAPAMTQPAMTQIQPTDPRIVTINRRLEALEQAVAALKQSVARNTFTCSDITHSVNGLGVSDDCNQYICNNESGRCTGYGQARSSSDCASGFSYDSGRCCKAVPGGISC